MANNKSNPRIFIAMHYMEIGGAEASLIGLLEALDPTRVDVDLFVYSHQGVFMKAIPDYVNLLPEKKAYAMMERPICDALRQGQIGVVLGRLWAKLRYRAYLSTLTDDQKRNDISLFPMVTRYVKPFLPSLYSLGTYDLAISYLQPHDIVRTKVDAKRYVAWIHTDYSTVHVNVGYEGGIWRSYDSIVSISPECRKGFLGKFPSLESQMLDMENILSGTVIRRNADGPLHVAGYRMEGILTLCSVGRIGYAKNYDNIPYMAQWLKRLMKSGGGKYGDFRWYIVGPGDHSAIDALSEKLGVKENVVFLGASDNPYPYIKHCDIYVHPSRYEGKSIVVREAQVLCKPVVITDYPTAHSQLMDGLDGVICPQDNRKIAETIYSLAYDEGKRTRIEDYLKTHDYTGVSEVEKIYKLCGL